MSTRWAPDLSDRTAPMPSVDARRSRLLPASEIAPATAAAAPLLRTPCRELTLRALILLSVLFLALIDWLPFYVDLRGPLWDRLYDLRSSYDTPIGLIAGTLALIVVLVALVGPRATTSCAVLLRPDVMVHAVNVLVLALVVPWWLQEDDADASDLFDGWG